VIDVDLQVALESPEQNTVPSEDALQTWVEAAIGKLKPDAELSIRIVEASESQSLNHQYRGKDKPTNVLSFPFEIPEELAGLEEISLIGDLVVCHDIVISEAEQQGKPLEHHYAHMIIHGCLHLLGFDHINEDEATEMESLEIDILSHLNIPNPYIIN